jgi:spore germination protein YaaH
MRLRGITALIASAAVAAATLVAAPPAVAAEAPRPIVSGWFGWWASDVAVNQMISQADGVVGEVAMFWWSFQEGNARQRLCLYDNGNYNGEGHGQPWCDSPTPWTTPKFDRQRKALQAAGIKVNASITDLGATSKGKLSAYLSDAKNRRAYAKQIADYAVKAGVDGIDLDWEVFAFHDDRAGWERTRESWVAMIKQLSEQLRARGLTLWATVPGGASPFVTNWMSPTNECGEARGGTGQPNPSTGYCVYAWSEIAPYVDRLNIMAYDYSWSVPGPIGPNDWAALVAKSAVEQLGEGNSGKVWIGAPQYGRDWPVASGSGWRVKEGCPAGWKPTTTPSKKSEMGGIKQRELAQRLGVKPTWNERYGEWTFQYWEKTDGKVAKKKVSCEILREVWYADERSALARASIVPEHQIGGIAVWQFDYVDASFYKRLADYGREIAPAATKVSVKAPKATTHGRTISVKVETESRAGAAKGAEATLYFQSQGGSATRAMVTSITLDAEGKGVFKVPAEASGSWSVSVEGSWSRASGESEPATTNVRYAVTAKASATKVAVGTPVTITGSVSPGAAGMSVTVQRRSASGAWRDVSVTTTGQGGSVSTTVKPTLAREASYRLLVPASSTLAQGTSARIVITVG